MKLKPVDAFPNCPGLSEHLGLKEASVRPPRIIGWGPWKKQWYSICSSRHDDPDCSLCKCGHYINVWRHFFTHLVHEYCWQLWYWRANKGKVTLREALKERRVQ